MYGDTERIRLLAARLRGQGEAVRGEADHLLSRAAAVPWTGQAADAMRAMARFRAGGLGRSARLHDEAADALERHAAEVDRTKALIAAIESAATELVAAARQRLADLASSIAGGLGVVAPDPVDQLLDRFVPPPPGHKDWLGVELPGLRDALPDALAGALTGALTGGQR